MYTVYTYKCMVLATPSHEAPSPYTCFMTLKYWCRFGQKHRYTVYMHGISGREITKYSVIYGAYIRFWPFLYVGIRLYTYGYTCVGLARTLYMHRI